MADNLLSVTEKTKLTDYAREVVARNARAGATRQEPVAPAEPADAFSPDGLRRRLTILENDFAALERRVEQNLSAILTTMQRIEARASQTSGELAAVREDLDAHSCDAAYMRDEMMAAAKDYGTVLNGEISRLVERIDGMGDMPETSTETAAPAARPNSSSKTPSKASGARRDG